MCLIYLVCFTFITLLIVIIRRPVCNFAQATRGTRTHTLHRKKAVLLTTDSGRMFYLLSWHITTELTTYQRDSIQECHHVPWLCSFVALTSSWHPWQVVPALEWTVRGIVTMQIRKQRSPFRICSHLAICWMQKQACRRLPLDPEPILVALNTSRGPGLDWPRIFLSCIKDRQKDFILSYNQQAQSNCKSAVIQVTWQVQRQTEFIGDFPVSWFFTSSFFSAVKLHFIILQCSRGSPSWGKYL